MKSLVTYKERQGIVHKTKVVRGSVVKWFKKRKKKCRDVRILGVWSDCKCKREWRK